MACKKSVRYLNKLFDVITFSIRMEIVNLKFNQNRLTGLTNDMNITRPIYVTRSSQICWAGDTSKKEQNEWRLCTKHDNINSQGLANSVVFSYLLGKYESSRRVSCKSQVDSVKC
jgi:hypothetical protein